MDFSSVEEVNTDELNSYFKRITLLVTTTGSLHDIVKGMKGKRSPNELTCCCGSAVESSLLLNIENSIECCCIAREGWGGDYLGLSAWVMHLLRRRSLILDLQM